MWLQILQAFALLAISAVGACLAWQQVRIARVKLQHDLFERRFRVFDATRRMLANVCATRDLSDEDERMFIVETADAGFVFDDEIANYLGQVLQHVIHLRAIIRTSENMPVGERRMAAMQADSGLTTWLNDQLLGLKDKFNPFLKFDKRQYETGCLQEMAAWVRRNVLRRAGL